MYVQQTVHSSVETFLCRHTHVSKDLGVIKFFIYYYLITSYLLQLHACTTLCKLQRVSQVINNVLPISDSCITSTAVVIGSCD